MNAFKGAGWHVVARNDDELLLAYPSNDDA